MVDWLLLMVLAVVCLTGLVGAVLQLPGNWLVLLAAVGYDACYHWQRLGWKWLVGIGALAAAGEVADLLATAIAAKRAGASRRAGIGALVGGLAGMVLFSIPVPIVGTILGGVLGCFAGAVVMELTLHDDLAKSARVGGFAAIGRIIGLVGKLAATTAMAGATISLVAISIWQRH